MDGEVVGSSENKIPLLCSLPREEVDNAKEILPGIAVGGYF